MKFGLLTLVFLFSILGSTISSAQKHNGVRTPSKSKSSDKEEEFYHSCSGFDLEGYIAGKSFGELERTFNKIEGIYDDKQVLDLGSYEVDGPVSPLYVRLYMGKNTIESIKVFGLNSDKLPYRVQTNKQNSTQIVDPKTKSPLLRISILSFTSRESGKVEIIAVKSKKNSQLNEQTLAHLTGKKSWGKTKWSVSLISEAGQVREYTSGDHEADSGFFNSLFENVILSPIVILDKTVGTVAWNAALSKDGREEIISDAVYDAATEDEEILNLFTDSSIKNKATREIEAKEKIRRIANKFARRFTPVTGTISNKRSLTKSAYQTFALEVFQAQFATLLDDPDGYENNTYEQLAQDVLNNTQFPKCLADARTTKGIADCANKFKNRSLYEFSKVLAQAYFYKYFADSIPESKHALVKETILKSIDKCAHDKYYPEVISAEKRNDKSFDPMASIQSCVYGSFIDGMVHAIPFSVEDNIKEYVKDGTVSSSEAINAAHNSLRSCLNSKSYRAYSKAQRKDVNNYSKFEKLDPDSFVDGLMSCVDDVTVNVGEVVVRSSILKNKDLSGAITDPAKMQEVANAAIDKGYYACIEAQKKSGQAIDVEKCEAQVTQQAILKAVDFGLDDNIRDNVYPSEDELSSDPVTRQAQLEDFERRKKLIKDKVLTEDLNQMILKELQSKNPSYDKIMTNIKVDATDAIINETVEHSIKKEFPDASEEELKEYIEIALKSEKGSIREQLSLVYQSDDEENGLNGLLRDLNIGTTKNLTGITVENMLRAEGFNSQDVANYSSEASSKMSECLEKIERMKDLDGKSINKTMGEVDVDISQCRAFVTKALVFSIFKGTLSKTLNEYVQDKKQLEVIFEEERTRLYSCIEKLESDESTSSEVFRVCPLLSSANVLGKVLAHEEKNIDFFKSIDPNFKAKQIRACTFGILNPDNSTEIQVSVDIFSNKENMALTALVKDKEKGREWFQNAMIDCALKQALPKVSEKILDHYLNPNRFIILNKKGGKLKENFGKVPFENITEKDYEELRKDLGGVVSILGNNVQKLDLFPSSEQENKRERKNLELNKAEIDKSIDMVIEEVLRSYSFDKDSLKDGLAQFKADLQDLFDKNEKVNKDQILDTFFNSPIGRAAVKAQIGTILKDQLQPIVSSEGLNKPVADYKNTQGIDGKLLDRLTNKEMLKRIFLSAKGDKLHSTLVNKYVKKLISGEIKEGDPIPEEVLDALRVAVTADIDEYKTVKEAIASKSTDSLIDKNYYNLPLTRVQDRFSHFSPREQGYIIRENIRKHKYPASVQRALDELAHGEKDDVKLASKMNTLIKSGQLKVDGKQSSAPSSDYLKNVTRLGFVETLLRDNAQKSLNSARQSTSGKFSTNFFIDIRSDGKYYNSFNWDNGKGVGVRDTSSGQEALITFGKQVLGPILEGGTENTENREYIISELKRKSNKSRSKVDIDELNEEFREMDNKNIKTRKGSSRLPSSKKTSQINARKKDYLFDMVGEISGSDTEKVYRKEYEDKSVGEVYKAVQAEAALQGIRLYTSGWYRVKFITVIKDEDIEAFNLGKENRRKREIGSSIEDATKEVKDRDNAAARADYMRRLNENYRGIPLGY